jgi:hypothetical protein
MPDQRLTALTDASTVDGSTFYGQAAGTSLEFPISLFDARYRQDFAPELTWDEPVASAIPLIGSFGLARLGSKAFSGHADVRKSGCPASGYNGWRIPMLWNQRDVARGENWERLYVFERMNDAGQSHIPGASGFVFLAWGMIEVDPDVYDYENLIIPARQWGGVAPKTVLPADHTKAEIFTAVYARSKADLWRTMAIRPQAAVQGRLDVPRSYNLTTNNPTTGAWGANGGNEPVAIEPVLLANVREEVTPTRFFYRWARQDDPRPRAVPELILGTQAEALELYWSGLYGPDWNQFEHELRNGQNANNSAELFTQRAEGATYTPSSSARTTDIFRLRAFNKNSGRPCFSEEVKVRTSVNADFASLTNPNVLATGDSRYSDGVQTNYLVAKAAADANFKPVFVGHVAATGGSHAAISGLRVAALYQEYSSPFVTAGRTLRATWAQSTVYALNDVVQQSASITDAWRCLVGHTSGGSTLAADIAANPTYWERATFGLNRYRTANSIGTVAALMLNGFGFNDVGGLQAAAEAASNAHAAAVMIEAIVANAKTDNANIKVGVGLCPSGAADKSAYGTNYGLTANWRNVWRNFDAWNEVLNTRFKNRRAENIFVIPYHMAMDTAAFYPAAAPAAANAEARTLTARGNWAGSTAYSAGDVVFNAAHLWGRMVCEIAHTSHASDIATDVAANRWSAAEPVLRASQAQRGSDGAHMLAPGRQQLARMEWQWLRGMFSGRTFS